MEKGGSMTGDPERRSLDSLADRLDHLFATVHPAGRGPYSNEEVAAAIREQGGEISGTYIWQLRKGKKDNPTKKHLEALAGFFGVPVVYFFEAAAARQVGAELETLKLLQDVKARRIGLRAVGLSERSMDTVAEMLDRVRELEGLPREDGETG
jgi:transcriptional regulator with XRE-family HTH domain